jgi:hypothetical protein
MTLTAKPTFRKKMSLSTEEIEALIQKKEIQLKNSQRESAAWNMGKYKTSSNATISRVLVSSLQREITSLYQQLEIYRAKKTG